MIANFLPKPNEIIEQSIMFNESMRGFGFKCDILIPTNIDLPEMGFQQEVGYDDAEKFVAYISLNSHPQPKLLQTLGWLIENDEQRPLICYIARYIQHPDRPRTPDFKNDFYKEILPTKYTRILLDYNYEDQGKDFIVTAVSSNEFNPVYYILKLAPYRPIVPINPDPLQDNNVERLNLQEFDNNFRFFNKDRAEQVDIKY